MTVGAALFDTIEVTAAALPTFRETVAIPVVAGMTEKFASPA